MHSLKSSTPEHVEGHEDDLTLAEAVHLANKWFFYSATNGGLLERTETSRWGTRDARRKLTAETRHAEPKEGWWKLHSSALFTLAFPQFSVDAVIHKGKWTHLAFTHSIIMHINFTLLLFPRGGKTGSGPDVLPETELPDLTRGESK